ncbi:FkbM family methyltransferase [Pendulispora rubella]|uniref:FkbM family methyltransferase n=1 Tax=Pendulispora rubella TaxID=2741070 RepID=A0ABZ2L312_9BACT
MLGVPKNEKPTWLSRLAARPEVHRAIRTFRLQEVTSVALKVRPIKRRLPNSGAEYRVRYLESFLMADEIFRRRIYREAFEGLDVRSFVDLGSNVGYFPIFAAELTGRRDLVGIAVDGNRAMTDETQWHIDHNRFANVKALWGIVGYPSDVKEATFYLNPSNVSCSAQPVLNPDVPSKGAIKEVTVPTVDVARAWKEHAGDQRVDVLKIDVEGFEREVLGTCGDLLARTSSVVVEWHKWIASEGEVESLLRDRGFERFRTISEDPYCGVAVYRPRAS